MSLISNREQLYLSNWAKTAESRIAKNMISGESYFEKRINEGTYLVEYAFDTANEMDEMIQKVCGDVWDGSLRKVCEVAALKERSIKASKEGENVSVESQHEEENLIPEFIYTF